MDVILVRHGEADCAPGLCIGRTDAPLSAIGFTAIQRLAAEWQGNSPRFLFSSDLRRAQQSAQVFAARFATEPLSDPRLREVDLGEWDGQRWDTIAANDGARYRHWADNWVIQEAPGGESFADVVRRTGSWLSALLGNTNSDDCVLAVAHAGSIRALLCHAFGLPPAKAFTLQVDYARASRIRYRNGQFEVSYLNASRFEAD
ncbi:histidine phosphatase family protein [Tahibacter amnicola]|uniref:Histidine phosphatase family protein n=1 Tax=Tahibacter amnicola TaxID=2976241 RepID=A0ABY6BDV5_9GAMM|nr:histidine phosphatase family protein [Tahibacter amnicola]UXI67423.1 histidine phosphatase family protein [Tahibacter amnicola]